MSNYLSLRSSNAPASMVNMVYSTLTGSSIVGSTIRVSTILGSTTTMNTVTIGSTLTGSTMTMNTVTVASTLTGSTIVAMGNMGIGTTAPATTLQVGSAADVIYPNNPLTSSKMVIFGSAPSNPATSGTTTIGGTLFINSTDANGLNV